MKKGLHFSFLYNKISKCQSHGSLVKRLRRRPLTAETGVRFPYELLTVFKQPNPKSAGNNLFPVLFFLGNSIVIP